MEAQWLARAIAFYLPQFHPIPENDEWWGPGFTEWTNVKKAGPLFKGHQQPRVPGELGYYDLRDANIRKAQAALAAEHGISAFCYWHYWFGNGRRILELPFDEVLKSKQPDFPFLLCWANQTWTGIWHGAPGRILIEQTYPGIDDHKRHFETVLPAFKDPRYFQVDGKPAFVIYMPADVPNVSEFIGLWTALAHNAGLNGIYFIGMGNGSELRELKGFDAFVRSEPGLFLDKKRKLSSIERALRILASKTLVSHMPEFLRRLISLPIRHDFNDLSDRAFSDDDDGGKLYFPCVLTGWDNTPRSGWRGIVLENLTLPAFRSYVKSALKRVAENSESRRIIFFKAWNEWAEGNYLEPDDKTGRSLLNIIREELDVDQDMERR